jgi:hypothetical protein
VERFPRDVGAWVVQPLVDAGLALEQVTDLVFRVVFDDVVSEGGSSVDAVWNVVRDQSAEVRSAWALMIGRLLSVDERAEAPAGE